MISPRPEDAEPIRSNDYESFAAAYAEKNDSGLPNAYYERPAMLELLGDIAGRRILDAGSGPGALSAEMHERGAVVTGVDASREMVACARHRLGDRAELVQADLGEPLPFDDDAFDDVVASLVLHYLEDWRPALSELRRVLRAGGRMFVSVDHPIVGYTFTDPRPDYFATTSYDTQWWVGGKWVPMRFWRKSLQEMLENFAEAGFRLKGISEPQPVPESRELHPDDFAHFSTAPTFIFFALEASGD